MEHAPARAEGRARDLGILLLPPMGYEDTCAYRPLRVLADLLAEAGHVVLRLDWPSLGDSALGALDPDLMAVWSDVVRTAARSLRDRGLARVAGLGVRAGALVALASGDLDELILWGLPTGGGRGYVREERAFHRMAAKVFGEKPADAPALPPGAVEAGGFLLSESTVKAFEALDPLVLAPAGRWARVLLLERDGTMPSPPLVEALRATGARVTVDPAPGLGVLLEDSYQSELRPEAARAIRAWCGAGASEGPVAPPSGAPHLRLEGDVEERPWVLQGARGALTGILSFPAGGALPGAAWTLFLNAGGIRRSGPNRLWTHGARRLAREGRPALRMDVRDVGDSDGVNVPHGNLEEMYSEASVQDVVAAYDWLLAQGAGAVDVVGLCSGSFLGIQLAARRQVRRALLFNGLAYIWNDEARAEGMTGHIGASLLNGRRWRRLLTGRIDARALARAVVTKAWLSLRGIARRALGRGGVDEVAELFAHVARRGTRIQLVSSEGDPSLPYLEGHLPPGDRPPLAVLPGVDHTIRPVWAHAAVVRMMLEAP
ncbi:MAG TPA: hypothetical protein VJ570_07930 [Holophagaceae bacterium]|nr:hypothetical protein [Holophagaceae bacterium]